MPITLITGPAIPDLTVTFSGIFFLIYIYKNKSYKIFLKNNLVKFTWRVHPQIDMHNVIKNLNLHNKRIPNNIKISKKTLRSDIIKNSFVLYRDTSAVVEAISGGNYPIYLNVKNEPNIDSIYDYKNNTKYISSVDQFLNLIKYSLKTKKIKNVQISGKKIQRELYGTLNQKKILNCLKTR